MPINLLSEEVINKIAAGEVIERPASVVKELLENSLDAQATTVLVELEDYGKKIIRVSDNGYGMPEEDARKSVLRHATSKIQSADDLFKISTLGFRGEALASIAAVSLFSLTTKTPEGLAGFNLKIDGGLITGSGVSPAEQGTIIEIRNLFYNTPARKKFLKTDAVELRHIIDVVSQYALFNPQISFRLLHNNHELLYAPPAADMRSNIAAVYGIDTAKELLEVQQEKEGLSLHGFISKPYHARNDKHQQTFFVNSRWIKNQDFVKAVYEGYHSLLFVHRHPVFLLRLQIDPQKIDVNVHPQKSEIRVEQKEYVTEFIAEAVRSCLQKHQLLPLVEMGMEMPLKLAKEPPQISSPAGKNTYAFEPSRQTMLKVQETCAVPYGASNIYNPPNDLKYLNNFPELKLLGQIHKTFFVAETQGGVFFIDQHAAHERVLYEELMAQLNQGNIASQQLLTGEILEFSAAEMILCKEFQKQFSEMGFQIEEFGSKSFVLKTAPAVFGRQQAKDLFLELLHTVEENRNKVHELREMIITRMACRAAVMAGEELTIARMERILVQLRETQLPYTCPHGRPTLLKTTAEELEKKFKRK